MSADSEAVLWRSFEGQGKGFFGIPYIHLPYSWDVSALCFPGKKKKKKTKKKKQQNHLDATRERQVTPLNSEEDTFSLNVILSMGYSKLYCESGPNKMAPLGSILSKREQ